MAGSYGDLFNTIHKIQTTYPQLAYLLDNAEIGPLLLKAASGEIDGTELQYKLQQTNWYKTTSGPARAWDAFASLDPATAKAQLAQERGHLHDLAGQMGVHLSLAGRRWISTAALRFGWDDSQIQDALVKQLKFPGENHQTKLAGQAAQTFQQLQSTAADYMVDTTDHGLFNRTKAILGGAETADGVAAEFKNHALNRYAGNQTVVDALQNGGTLKGFFDPYRTAIANELEITPDQVDLMHDPRWSQVVNYADPNKAGVLRPMTLSETQKLARTSSRWGQTQQAKASVAQFGDFLGNTFGRVSGGSNSPAAAT